MIKNVQDLVDDISMCGHNEMTRFEGEQQRQGRLNPSTE